MTATPTPQEDLSFCPPAGLPGKDPQGPDLDKLGLAVAATAPL